jgi:hypothetical protein
MHSKQPRAEAISQLTAPTFLSTTTPNRFWASAVWDGHAYNSIGGTFYAGASCNLVLRQAQASGYWDYVSARDVGSGVAIAFEEPLVGQYLQAVVTTVSGLTPTVFRLKAWGKAGGNALMGYNNASGNFKLVQVSLSGLVITTT